MSESATGRQSVEQSAAAMLQLIEVFHVQVDRQIARNARVISTNVERIINDRPVLRALVRWQTAHDQQYIQHGVTEDLRPAAVDAFSSTIAAIEQLDLQNLSTDGLRELASASAAARAAIPERVPTPTPIPVPPYAEQLMTMCLAIGQQAAGHKKLRNLADAMPAAAATIGQNVTEANPTGYVVLQNGQAGETGTAWAAGLQQLVPILREHVGMTVPGSEHLDDIVASIRAHKLSVADQEIAGYCDQLHLALDGLDQRIATELAVHQDRTTAILDSAAAATHDTPSRSADVGGLGR